MPNQEPERITDFIIALSPHNRQRGIDMIEGLIKAERIKARIEERERIVEIVESMNTYTLMILDGIVHDFLIKNEVLTILKK